MRRGLFVGCLLLTVLVATAWAELRTFELHGADAAELVQVLRDQLGGEARVSAYRNRLIVQGTPDQLALAEKLVADLDRPVAQLLLEVRQELRQAEAGTDVRGTIRLGTGPDEARLGAQRTLSNSRRTLTQSLRVQVGELALIRLGQETPYVATWGIWSGEQQGVAAQVAYLPTEQGYQVLPESLVDDQVQLRVNLVMATADSKGVLGGGSRPVKVERRAVTTTVRVPLGEWVNLSQSLRNGRGDEDAVLSWRTGQYERYDVWLRLQR